MSEKIAGIYKIENTITHKVYIGQSKDIFKRWQDHRCRLKEGKHDNRYLQNAWDKYGDATPLIWRYLDDDADPRRVPSSC